MNEAVRKMVMEWLDLNNGNMDSVAKWMSKSLHLGTLKQCKELIKEAVPTELWASREVWRPSDNRMRLS